MIDVLPILKNDAESKENRKLALSRSISCINMLKALGYREAPFQADVTVRYSFFLFSLCLTILIIILVFFLYILGTFVLVGHKYGESKAGCLMLCPDDL